MESRPHPDYCGPKWWQDMDVILDEARKRDMKVWILDDSHFPTGFCNGALKGGPDELCRQSVTYRILGRVKGGACIDLERKDYGTPASFEKTLVETGADHLAIEVATTLERAVSVETLPGMAPPIPMDHCGIHGHVGLWVD